MRKKLLISAGAGAVILLSTVMPSFAAAPANFGGEGGAFTNDYGNHYVNNNNPEVRFDWDNHRIAVPGEAWEYTNSNSAVVDNGGYSLVDPLNTL